MELRVPFLDYQFVEYVLSIPHEHRVPQCGYEKYILRETFETFLPSEIVWRRKEGFSDGVGSVKAPWYKYIQDYAEQMIDDELYDELKESCYIKLLSKEAALYYKLYKEKFEGMRCIPYYWMPKWQEANLNDPSGRCIKAAGDIKD